MAYKIYGLTHAPDDTPIIRTPRSVKVGIGVPKGKDIYAYVDNAGKFVVATNHGKDKFKFDTVEEARNAYREKAKHVGDRSYPAKLPHFVFTKLSATGMFEPDWEAMAAHGPTPTEIDIIFLEDDPFDAQLEMWATTGLQCSGDGINAQRILSLARTPEDKKLAAEAQKQGLKTFPILEGCRERGCPYAQGDAPLCKPHGKLRFQLLSRPTLGGNAQFDTTGFRSVGNLASCLEEMKGFTQGRVAGIPLKLIVRPHNVTVFDKKKGMKVSSMAYNVAVEFRTEQAETLKQALIEQAARWANSGGTEYPKALPESRGLPAPELPPDGEDFEDIPEELQGQMMEAEFYPVNPEDAPAPGEGELPADDGEDFEDRESDDLPPDNEDFSEPGEPNVDRTVQTATEDATEALLRKLAAAEEAKKAAKQAAAEAPPAPREEEKFEATDDDLPPVLQQPDPPQPKPAPTPKAAPAKATNGTATKGAQTPPRNLFGNASGGWD